MIRYRYNTLKISW